MRYRISRLTTRLFFAYFTIILLIILISAISIGRSFSTFYKEDKSADLQSRALLIAHSIDAGLIQNRENLTELCVTLGLQTSTRFTIIDESGIVLADSHKDPGQMNNHADRPEVQSAREGMPRSFERYSYTLKEDMMYLAIPVELEGQTVYIRASFPMTALIDKIHGLYWNIFLIAILIGAFALAVSYYISSKFSIVLKEIKDGAKRFANQDFSQEVIVSGSDEVEDLVASLNDMAAQLDTRIRTILDQRNEKQAVLSSMVEGVMAVDCDGKFISMNKSAKKLFQIPRKKSIGKPVYEIIRNSDLVKFIDEVLVGRTMLSTELVYQNGSPKFFNVRGTVLMNSEDEVIGAVFVIYDVTRTRRLESVRAEFVANVSHELKTPVTTIKGFVETLKDTVSPSDTQKFLKIIESNTNRLDEIINDLLELSRIEEQEEGGKIGFDRESLLPILEGALDECAALSMDRGIAISLSCPETLGMEVNQRLLQEAVVNLISNAIKYSEENTEVTVEAGIQDEEVYITVTDQGIGIPEEHQDRIFERFYRVDKGRSRDLGGTGLGLSIVKHIINLHYGVVTVKSKPGKGSTFTILLPIEPA